MILVGGPSGRGLLAREIGVGGVRSDIVEFPETEERVRLVLDETPGRRGADFILECAAVPAAVGEGWEMTSRGGTGLALGQYTDCGVVPLNPESIISKTAEGRRSMAPCRETPPGARRGIFGVERSV